MTAQAPTAPADVYAEVQHFYARQMRLLDTGEADAWAGTFTEDGSFAPPSRPQPVRGRPALAAGARQSAADIAAGARRSATGSACSPSPRRTTAR
ncbi:hypothetical protein SVIOM342S_07854 [Streptomyces violaceorubidus]